MTQTIVTAGEVVLLTTGSYSDYGPIALFRARETFDIGAMQDACRAAWVLDHPNEDLEDQWDREYVLAAFLLRNNKVEEIAHRELRVDGDRSEWCESVNDKTRAKAEQLDPP